MSQLTVAQLRKRLEQVYRVEKMKESQICDYVFVQIKLPNASVLISQTSCDPAPYDSVLPVII